MAFAFACFSLDRRRAIRALERLGLHFIESVEPARLGKGDRIEVRLGWPDPGTDDIELLSFKFEKWSSTRRQASRPSAFPVLVIDAPDDVQGERFSSQNVRGTFAGAPSDGAELPLFARVMGRTIWLTNDDRELDRARDAKNVARLVRAGWSVEAGSADVFALQDACNARLISWG